MIFLKVKDLKYRRNYNKIEKLRQVKKFVFTNLLSNLIYKNKSVEVNQRIAFLISKTNKKLLSKIKIVRRCILTNRSRRNMRSYHISHTGFRNLIQFGLVPGVKKSIW